MTDFDTYELSAYESKPIEYYHFYTLDSDGNIRNEWNYTNYFEDITYDSTLYTAIEIERSEYNNSADNDDNQIRITINSLATIITDHIISYADDNINLVIYKEQNKTYSEQGWKGYVVQFNVNKTTSTISCDNGMSSANRPMLNMIYSSQCPYVLYGASCGVEQANYQDSVTVIGISGLTVYINGGSTDNGYYKAGIIETDDGEVRTVQTHYGNRLKLIRPFAKLEVGDSILVSRGCDHTKEACADIFNNILNNGGFYYMPDRNPYSGDGLEV